MNPLKILNIAATKARQLLLVNHTWLLFPVFNFRLKKD